MIDKINDKNIIKHIKQDADALLLCKIRMKFPVPGHNAKYFEETLKTNIAELAKSILKESTALIEFLEKNLKNKQEKHEEALELKSLMEFMLISHNEIKNITASLINKLKPVNNKSLDDLHDLVLNFCRDWKKVANHIDGNDIESSADLTQITLENTVENIDSSSRK